MALTRRQRASRSDTVAVTASSDCPPPDIPSAKSLIPLPPKDTEAKTTAATHSHSGEDGCNTSGNSSPFPANVVLTQTTATASSTEEVATMSMSGKRTHSPPSSPSPEAMKKRPRLDLLSNAHVQKAKPANEQQIQQQNEPPLYCVLPPKGCPYPDIEFGFMLCCDGCDRWFHGTCVNITEKEAADIDPWFCSVCSEAAKEEALVSTCASPLLDVVRSGPESLHSLDDDSILACFDYLGGDVFELVKLMSVCKRWRRLLAQHACVVSCSIFDNEIALKVID